MYQKIDVESGSACTPLYPMMLESPELQWAFIRKIYSIVTVQLLLTIAVAAAVVTVEPISVFFTTTYTGLALYIVLIITPFIGISLYFPSPQLKLLQLCRIASNFAVLWPLAYHYKRHPVNYFHCCLGFCSAIDVCFYQRSFGEENLMLDMDRGKLASLVLLESVF
ncbi:hypothetical protein Vadar_034759 [Vaccinium darrowii]|uniref:Uncharacterized protein n=1 Tax=Vaccinium darrowii TaxID=229202 RepID=A0ACB7YAL0_9ERIC|nr:hypothetical protein Vadar_034759 [Vaccinium darrowii]